MNMGQVEVKHDGPDGLTQTPTKTRCESIINLEQVRKQKRSFRAGNPLPEKSGVYSLCGCQSFTLVSICPASVLLSASVSGTETGLNGLN